RLAAAGGAATRWVEDFSPGALKAIGAVELLAAAGLVLPAVLGIAPVVVPLAATGLVLLFVCAVTMRLRRGERATITGDVVYLALALFLAWGRFGPEPFSGLPSRAGPAGHGDDGARARLVAPYGLSSRCLRGLGSGGVCLISA